MGLFANVTTVTDDVVDVAAAWAVVDSGGKEAAYQRIRTTRFQAGIVPEPLNMEGWQIVDELNRELSKASWLGPVPKVHLEAKVNDIDFTEAATRSFARRGRDHAIIRRLS